MENKLSKQDVQQLIGSQIATLIFFSDRDTAYAAFVDIVSNKAAWDYAEKLAIELERREQPFNRQ